MWTCLSSYPTGIGGKDAEAPKTQALPLNISEWPFALLTPSCSSGNHIRLVTGLDPEKLISLHTLELRANQLESTMGINLPMLKNLFLVAPWVRGWLVQGRRHCGGGQDAWLLVGSATNFVIMMIIGIIY